MQCALAHDDEHCKTSFDADFGGELATQAASLSTYARRLTGTGTDADDLLQDTMLRCWSARHSFHPGTSLSAWARTVMRNSFLTSRRRARFQVEFPEDISDRLSVAENQSNVVELRDADWALSELTAEQREAVLLASQGVTTGDAAAQLAIPLGTFASRLLRGRLRLRQLIEDKNTPSLTLARKLEQPPRQRRDWRNVVIG